MESAYQVRYQDQVARGDEIQEYWFYVEEDFGSLGEAREFAEALRCSERPTEIVHVTCEVVERI